MSSSELTWTYQYNNRRLLKSEWLSWPSQTPGTGWNFYWAINAQGDVAGLTDPWGWVDYAPDALGRPTRAGAYAAEAYYHPNGSLAGMRLGNGVVHQTQQNVRGLPELWRDHNVIQYRYRHDAAGNVQSMADEFEGLAGVSMQYDGLDRLTVADGRWGFGHFQYDALDNITRSTVGSRSLVHHTDPATQRLVAMTGSQNIGIGYDANGNVIQRGAQAYHFDLGNRLRHVHGRAYYYYDGHGRRHWLGRADGSGRLSAYSLSGQLLFTWDSTHGHTRFASLGKRLVAEVGEGGAVTYVHTDALGSPVARSNAAGQVTSRTRYEPYGAVAEGAVPQGVGYTGHVNDADTALVYMQQRYYDPIAGAFLSVDPVVTDWDSGRQFNRYVYAHNNPYGFVDPDGRLACSSDDEGCRQQREAAERRGLPILDGRGSGVATPPSGAANAPGGPYIEPTWGEVGVGVGIGAGIAVSAAAPQTVFIVGARQAARGVANPVSGTFARVVPGNLRPTSLGKPGDLDVFVTNARELRGLSANQIANKLAIPQTSPLRIIEFPSAKVQGIASPINRTNPGFVGGGKTAAGASEFVIPNGPIPVGASQRVVH